MTNLAERLKIVLGIVRERGVAKEQWMDRKGDAIDTHCVEGVLEEAIRRLEAYERIPPEEERRAWDLAVHGVLVGRGPNDPPSDMLDPTWDDNAFNVARRVLVERRTEFGPEKPEPKETAQ